VVFEQLVDALPAVRGCCGWPRRWPHKLHADKGYDYARCRFHLRKLGITARIARRGIERNGSASRPGIVMTLAAFRRRAQCRC